MIVRLDTDIGSQSRWIIGDKDRIRTIQRLATADAAVPAVLPITGIHTFGPDKHVFS